MKKSQSNEFMEMLPRLLQAMKHVNDAGYVGVLSKEGADKLCEITKTLQNILKIQKEYQYHRNHMLSLMQ